MEKHAPMVVMALAVGVTMSGCTVSHGKYFNYADANRVKNGMTREQVINIMGDTPYQVQDNKMVWSWSELNMITGSTSSRAVGFAFDGSGKTYDVPDGGAFRNVTPYLDDQD